MVQRKEMNPDMDREKIELLYMMEMLEVRAMEQVPGKEIFTLISYQASVVYIIRIRSDAYLIAVCWIRIQSDPDSCAGSGRKRVQKTDFFLPNYNVNSF